MRRGGFLLAVFAVTACKAGEGRGTALGPFYIIDCNGAGKNLGTRDAPVVFNLNPAFFAAEPIDDPSYVPKINRLIIRLQPTGRSRELNDVLTFDVLNSHEVARCVRARVVGGKPDYDEKNCMQGPNGPRLRVGPDALIRSSLAPYSTCKRRLVASAEAGNSPDPNAWQSWIELTEFGTATKPGPADSRPAVPDNFKVDLNEPLRAPAFLLKMTDDAVLFGRRPQDAPEIAGTLEGFFDFNLQRGQGAQTFP
jgi:hypothetical protein